MSLKNKALFWMLGVVIILLLSSLLSFRVLEELHQTDRVIANTYQMATHLRQIRIQLFSYDDYSLMAAMNNDEEEYHQKRNEHYQQLLSLLEQGLRPDAGADLVKRFTSLKEEIGELLGMRLEEKYSHFRGMEGGDRPEVQSLHKRALYLNPHYLRKYVSVMNQLEALINQTSKLVEEKIDQNQNFYGKNVRVNWIIFTTTFLLVLSGLFYFRWRIIWPIHRMIKGLGRIRQGDWEVRLDENSQDEIGEVGRTINQMIKDLQVRRKERIKFIGSVAHDIKNPLAAINLNCDLILRNAERIGPEMTQNYVRRIKDQVFQLIRLTEDLLQTAKDSGPHWEMKLSSFSLEQLGHEVLEFFRPTHPEYVFELQCSFRPLEILADRERIYQVLSNLVSNAVKYSPSSSRIRITLGRIQHEVIMEVEDEGIGIPEEKRESIFEPFTRLEKGRELSTGTGLGLSIVRDIIWAHRGKISVDSSLTGGSVFRVILPQSSSSTAKSRFIRKKIKEQNVGQQAIVNLS